MKNVLVFLRSIATAIGRFVKAILSILGTTATVVMLVVAVASYIFIPVYYWVLTVLIVLALMPIIGHMLMSHEFLVGKENKDEKNPGRDYLDSFLRHFFGNGVYGGSDAHSHRKNWEARPTGVNWKYFFGLAFTLIVLAYVIPALFPLFGFSTHTMIDDLSVGRLYFYILCVYFLLSALPLDGGSEQDDETGAGAGGDIRTMGRRPYVRMNERGVIFFWGFAICEVSGSVWLFLPMGFSWVQLLPKNLIQREITHANQRLDSLKDLSGVAIDKKLRLEDSMSRPQTCDISVARAWAIPRGFAMAFVKRMHTVTEANTVMDDATHKELERVSSPLSYRELSGNKEDVGKRLLEFCQVSVREPFERLFKTKKDRTDEAIRRGYSDGDTFGIDLLYIQITKVNPSGVITEADNKEAASIATLTAGKREATKQMLLEKAKTEGPIKGMTDGTREMMLLLGYINAKGEVQSGHEKEVQELFKRMIDQKTLAGLTVTNVNVGDNVYSMMDKFLNQTKAA